MADRNFNATANPTNINTSLPLTAGNKYRIQNVDSAAVLYLREASVKPTGGALRGFRLAPYRTAYWEVATGMGLWAWSASEEGCICVVGDVTD